MTTEELMQVRPWFTQNANLPNQPVGMLGGHEALLCYYIAKDAFRGYGTIVDAGSFLGKSAYFFAQGLRANPCFQPGRHLIHCFENFLVNETGTAQFIQDYLAQTKSVGDSTRAIFDSQVMRVRDMLQVHAGDFDTVSWQHQPIEILMVDIAKTESLGKHVVKEFFPYLLPGESFVIQQDYHHPWLPHIHIVMEHLADYFELVAPRVDDSAVFRYRKTIPAEVLQRAVAYDFSYEEQLKLMDDAISRLPEEDRFYVKLARIVLQYGKTDEIALRRELDQIEQRFNRSARNYSRNPYFADVRTQIDEREGWRQISAGNYRRSLQLADTILARRRSTHTLTLRGRALIGLEHYSDAENDLRAALRMNPPTGFAYIELARALMHQDRLAEAEAQLLAGLRDRSAVNATSCHYLALLGSVWQLRNDPPHEAAIISQLHLDLPGDPEVSALEKRMREHWAGQNSG
jgi:hypothetical protein